MDTDIEGEELDEGGGGGRRVGDGGFDSSSRNAIVGGLTSR